jgi:hypothetical protein
MPFRVRASCTRCGRTTAYLYMNTETLQDVDTEELAGRLFQHMASVHAVAHTDQEAWQEAMRRARESEVEPSDGPQQQPPQPPPTGLELQPLQHAQPAQPAQPAQRATDPATQQLLLEALHVLIGIQRDIARHTLFIVDVLEARLPPLPPAHRVVPQCASFM